ncbi:MAG: 50S ribosomal protein L11 methyltransferase, partial [Atribacterota bacterium]
YFLQPLPQMSLPFVERWWQEEEEEGDWGKWRENFSPIWIDEDLVVRPPWEEKMNALFDVVIYPAYAFGTGHHPTTYGCLRFIKKYFQEGMSFLDVGIGSGILSILALKMGAKRVYGIDVDPLAIEEVQRNLALNDLENSHVELFVGDMSRVEGKFDFIVANIGPYFSLKYLLIMTNHLEKGGKILLSGFEEGDWPPIEQKIHELRLVLLEKLTVSSWMSVVCQS